MDSCPMREKEHDFIAYWPLKPLFIYLTLFDIGHLKETENHIKFNKEFAG